jgi:hypothetical protein
MLRFPQVTLLLLGAAFVFSLVILISSIKYAVWASPTGMLGTSRWVYVHVEASYQYAGF